jgi:hypothetical protein
VSLFGYCLQHCDSACVVLSDGMISPNHDNVLFNLDVTTPSINLRYSSTSVVLLCVYSVWVAYIYIYI